METGITGATDIEVTSGLKEGDEIVTGSYQVIRTIRNGRAGQGRQQGADQDRGVAERTPANGTGS